MKLNNLFLIFLAAIVLFGCEKDLSKMDIYKRPDWLAGKVYTQVSDNPDLSTFAQCIQLSGYDTIINVAGSYTVFAPNNEAFNTYLNSKPEYNTIEDIPKEDLVRLVKYHIVQNPWSLDQLRSLDIHGWIDTLDLVNNKPRGFKRETLLLDEDKDFGVSYVTNEGFIIVDSNKAQLTRKVITDSRKYIPIFYSEFFDIYNLDKSNYSFYFDRDFDDSHLYYAGAKIDNEEIFAENGFVHVIDKVIEPLPSVYQILNNTNQGNDYSDFMKLINTFSEFAYNEEKTLEQPGAELGLVVDSLFDLNFPDLTFNVVDEKVSYSDNVDYVTIRYHQGLAAPTNEALNDLISEYFVGDGKWGSLEDVPSHLKRIIVNSHMSETPMFQTYIQKGFKNGENDFTTIDENDIKEKRFASNATFLGLNKAIVPRAFNSVTGPVYLEPRFSHVMNAVEYSGLLSTLKRGNQNYSFFVETNDDCEEDSTLFYQNRDNRDIFTLFVKGAKKKQTLTLSDVRNLLLNHIGQSSIQGVARKEFIKTLSGNYLVVNNQTGEVQGTGPTSEGYRGAAQKEVIPKHIFEASNGTTYSIKHWFTFSPQDVYSQITTRYPAFHQLIADAGLYVENSYEYGFLSKSERYTIFAPSALALSNYNTDTLTKAELQNFIKAHFIQGEIIFTDGKVPSGYYETVRVDEKSTELRKVYTSINLDVSVDQITIKSKDGGDYYTIDESDKTNILCGYVTGRLTEVYPASYINGVIHEIDQVLLVNQLDVE